MTEQPELGTLEKMMIEPTKQNLGQYGAKPLTQWLISAAKERTSITYGEAKRRLEDEHDFTTIFSPMMGNPAGKAIENIHDVSPNAPLLNVLLVQQGDRMPGKGAGSFMAKRFNEPKLGQDGARKKYPNLWKSTFNRAADEVYAFQDWEAVFEGAYGTQFNPDSKAVARRKGTDGTEKDGLRRGRHGEGDNHKALRLWVWVNPHQIAPRFGSVRTETEVVLRSADRVDVVYYAPKQTLAVEVKSRDSDDSDIERGIYQCVKYQAVLRAQDPRTNPNIRSLLVTEKALEPVLRDLANKLGIRHRVVPQER